MSHLERMRFVTQNAVESIDCLLERNLDYPVILRDLSDGWWIQVGAENAFTRTIQNKRELEDLLEECIDERDWYWGFR